jgi:hypothetical protein
VINNNNNNNNNNNKVDLFSNQVQRQEGAMRSCGAD